MKHSKKIITLALIMLLLFSSTASAGTIELIPNTTINSSNEVIADKYPMHHYFFDTEKMGILDVLPGAFYWLSNGLFYLNVLFSKLVNFILTQAFTFNIFDFIQNIFDQIVVAISESVFIPMLGILIPFAGLFILFMAFSAKKTRAVMVAFQTILILVIAAVFIQAPTKSITFINDLARELSGNALGATARLVNHTSRVTNEDAVVQLSNVYWGSAVENPWMIIEFGTTVQRSDMEDYIINPVNDSGRVDKAQNNTNFMFTKESQIIRFIMALFLLIVNIIMGSLIIVLSGLMFISQFSAIVAAVIAVFGLTIALLPNMGLRVAIHGFYNVFEFLFTRLAITLLLCVYFAISVILYDNTAQIGWFLVMILQLTLIATMILNRKKIFSFIYGASKGQGAVMQSLHQKQEQINPFKMYAYAKIGQDAKQQFERLQDRRIDKQLTPTAEKYLNKRYYEEKQNAENYAKQHNTSVQYSDFVKKVDSRVEKGFNPFTNEEVQSTTVMMRNLKKQGDNPSHLIMTGVSGKQDGTILKNQLDLEQNIAQTQDNLMQKRFKNAETIDQVIKTNPRSEHYDEWIYRDEERAKQLNSQLQAKNQYNESSNNKLDTNIDEKVQNKDINDKQNDINKVKETTNEKVNKSTETTNVTEKVQNKDVKESQKNENKTAAKTNEKVDKSTETKNITEKVQNKDVNELQKNENKVVDTINEKVDKYIEIANITEKIQNKDINELQKNENKVVNTVNEKVDKNVEISNIAEKVVNNIVKENTTVLNAENVTENKTKEIKNFINNVENKTINNNEIVNNNVINTNNETRNNNLEARNIKDVFSRLEFQDKNENNVEK